MAAQLRTSLSAAMQYRADFFVDGLVEVLWMSSAIVPLWVVFSMRTSLAGWSASDALLVTAFFTILQGVMEGFIAPSMLAVVEQIRKGTFDFVLLKPVDNQLYVSTAKIQLWKCINILTGLVLIGISIAKSGHVPSAIAALHACVMLLAASGILYAIWLMGVSLSFKFGRIDNLTYLFVSIFDAARWPSSVFRGVVRILFTYVIPLTIMTTFPARALLGNLHARETAVGVTVSLAFLVLSRFVWKLGLARYTSASS
ncbi:MAG: ABC-2 family transporter protein [Polyangiaceae bacterium]